MWSLLLMALSVFTGQFALSTAAAGNTQDVTDSAMAGIDSSSKAVVIFSWNRRTTNGNSEASHAFGMGYAVSSTDRGGATSSSFHGNTAMGADCQWFDNSCIKLLTPALAGGSVDGSMDFNSFITNGFRLDIDDAFVSAYLVNFIAIWGSDLLDAKSVTASVTATGNTNITSVGFQPDCVLTFTCDPNVAVNTASTYSQWGIGVADTALNNYTLSGGSTDAAGTAITNAYCRSGDCVSACGDDIVTHRSSITAWLSNGFTVNCAEKVAGTSSFRALCLRGPQFAARDFLTATDTNNFNAFSLSYTPSALMFVSACRAASSSDTPTAHDTRSVGFAISNTVRNCMAMQDKDAATSGDVWEYTATDSVYGNPSTDTAQVLEGQMDVVSLGTTTTLVMDDADPAQSFVWCLAIAGAAFTADQFPWPDQSQVYSTAHRGTVVGF